MTEDLTGYTDKHEYVNKNGIHSVVYLMDNMEAMSQMRDKEFGLVCADPPYGLDVANMNMGMGKGKRCSKAKNRNWKPKDWDVAPGPEYFDEIFRVSVNQIIWGGNYFNLPPSQYFAIWDKAEGLYGRDFAEAEYAWVRSGGTRIHKQAPVQKDRQHPTQKPVELYRFCFHHYAKPGEAVFDPNLGSGSSRIAADEYNLPFLATETDPEYFYDHCKRFDRYTAQLTLF